MTLKHHQQRLMREQELPAVKKAEERNAELINHMVELKNKQSALAEKVNQAKSERSTLTDGLVSL